jgi:hypothetical protein
MVDQLIKNVSPFMEPVILTPCSQGLATGGYPEPENPGLLHHHILFKIHFNIHLGKGLQKYLAPSGFRLSCLSV